MIRCVLGAGCVAASIFAVACGGGGDEGPTARTDGGSVEQPDADGDGAQEGGAGEAGAPDDAGRRDDAGDRDAGDTDAGQEPNHAVVTSCIEGASSRDSQTEALRFSGHGASVGVVRFVDPDAFGTSGTTVWLPERLAVAHGATAECMSDAGQLQYQVSHHNFDDSFSAVNAGTMWIWKQTREEYDVPTQWTIEARQDGALLWGPVQLSLESCTTLNDDSDCSGRYL